MPRAGGQNSDRAELEARTAELTGEIKATTGGIIPHKPRNSTAGFRTGKLEHITELMLNAMCAYNLLFCCSRFLWCAVYCGWRHAALKTVAVGHFFFLTKRRHRERTAAAAPRRRPLLAS